MITETRESRTRLLHYEQHHRRPRRRYHTLDNGTLDKFNFICIPLHRDESRTDSSSSQTNLTMTQPTTKLSISSISILPTTANISPGIRRVRFKFDEHDRNQIRKDFNNHRHTRSFDDVSLSENNSRHRVEVEIPIYKDTNPWLNVACSTTSSLPAKTRSLTSQKIDIKHTNKNPMRLQGIAPFIEAEISSQKSSMNDCDKTQAQWYRQMYGHLHKPPETQQEYQKNPYKPTYTFPEEFDGDSDHMEDYIRKTASQTNDKDNRMTSSSIVRPLTSSLKNQRTTSKRSNGHIEKVTRFEDYYSSPVVSPPLERPKSNNDGSTGVASSVNINLQSNSNHISTPDNEQKLIYKRILRGGEIPSNGLQKLPNNNRELRWHVERPKKKPSNGTNGHTEQQTWTNPQDSNRQKSEYKPQISQLNSPPIYKALALHSFYAQTSRELSFKKGDILLVLRRINDDWLEGEHQGFKGIFPLNHVELFPMETSEEEDNLNDSDKEHEIEGEAIVKYDFIPEKTFELQLRKGDKVILLRRLDNNWYEGRLNHIEGIFPAAYVETLREPPEILSKNSQPIEPVKPSPAFEHTSTEKIDTLPDLSLSIRKCQVLYDYTPQNPDELEIHVGDIINVIEMCDDGWYCGIMEKSNQKNSMEFGTFPGNYVKLLPI